MSTPEARSSYVLPSHPRLQRLAPFVLTTWALLGCSGGDDDEDASTHGHEETAHGHEESESGHSSTGHGHEESESGHASTEHEHTSESGHEDSTSTASTGEEDVHASYCSCVWSSCHDAYHERWGEDEVVAEQSCLAEAESVPTNGAPIEAGNFIECRLAFCQRAATDETHCAAAFGESPCSDP